MLIGDLEKDTTVTIHVTDGIKAVQLNSQVLELSNHSGVRPQCGQFTVNLREGVSV